MTDHTATIKKALADNTSIVGTKRTLKAIRKNAVRSVFLTKNTPQEIRDTIDYYAQLNNITCIELSQSNEELGLLCRKPFLISVMAIAK